MAGVLLALVACRRGTVEGAGGDAGSHASPIEAGPLAAAPLLVPARCHPAEGGFAVEPHDDALEIGDAIGYPKGVAVGLVHRTTAGRVAAVALLPADESALRVIDLGPTLGDAPPPRLAWRGRDLIAAAFALPSPGARAETQRELALHVLGRGGEDRPLLSILQQRDDSLAFDVAWVDPSGGIAAWDEDTAGPTPRGVVRLAALAPDGHASPTRDASPVDSDAEMPRVMPAGSGFFVLWLARRPEAPATGDASSDLEATGEARAYSWLEMVAIDAHGAPGGAVRRLTPTSGHVSAYDVQMLPGEARPTALVVARDDGEAIDGSGGVLLRVRAREDGAEPPVALPGDGLGRGAPTLVDAPAPWLAWVGPHEELRLLPLDAAGAPFAPPSAEPGLEESRPLLVLRGSTMLVARPEDAAAQLRPFACGP
ncbi:MAG TPA: hypothetical protein VIF15_12875 [Polyangiaceae bacterium]